MIENFQSELFEEMISSGDLLSEVTQRLEGMRINSEENEISPMSDSGRFNKRVRAEPGSVSKYFSKSGTIFDPLLYLRVQSDDSSVPNPLDSVTTTPSTPSLESIFDKDNSKAGLLIKVQNNVPRVKSAHPRTSTNSGNAPLRDAPKLPVAVFRFCQENEAKVLAVPLSRTYRSIVFSKNRESMNSDDPWEIYTIKNKISHYRLCHALYFSSKDRLTGDEGRVVVIVPHTSKTSGETDVELLSNLLGMEIKRASLTQVEKELGFPTFVCPPFGHELSPKQYSASESSKLRFKTVIDSSLTREAKTDCVFDLGIVAMRIRPSELKRLAANRDWIVVDKIVRKN